MIIEKIHCSMKPVKFSPLLMNSASKDIDKNTEKSELCRLLVCEETSNIFHFKLWWCCGFDLRSILQQFGAKTWKELCTP